MSEMKFDTDLYPEAVFFNIQFYIKCEVLYSFCAVLESLLLLQRGHIWAL